MPTKIRLQRRGKKGQAFYHIVIADGRAPRDGRFIEKIGTYNPLSKPADIDIDIDKALEWLQKGAQPSDTVRAILFYRGVLYKNHLLKGLKKGALTEEQVETKFQAWQSEKMAKISSARKEHELSLKDARKKKLAEEARLNEAKANSIADKLAKAAKAAAAEHAHEITETITGTTEDQESKPAEELPASQE